jgi:hypothetical protein
MIGRAGPRGQTEDQLGNTVLALLMTAMRRLWHP